MKKIIYLAIGVLLLAGFAGTVYFLYQKDQEKPVFFKTDEPEKVDILLKTVATGSIVPRQEIEIKPRVSGVIDELFVEAGDLIKKGQLIARIKIIPNVVTLNNAENRLKTARLNLENARQELDRQKILMEQNATSQRDYDQTALAFRLAEEEKKAAENNLELVKKGSSKNSSTANNMVYSTVNGTVLDVPVKEGASVIESNNFNDGTTIIFVADMDDMIFEGTVDEAEVGKIKEGMPLIITIGALQNEQLEGNLEFIAPKGKDDQGTIQFPIKAAVKQKEGIYIRAGYSANAEIVLEKAENTLAVKESLVLFDDDGPYVEVLTAEEPQQFERRFITTGLSDGVYIQIKDGLKGGEKLKVVESYGKMYR